MAKETQKFETEVQQILDLMIHSLYSNKEIFLRELISNASDAIDRLKFEALTRPELKTDSNDFEIRLIPNVKERTLQIIDNGIGMSYDEVKTNIGTIAHSGTKKFLQMSEELKSRPELIGQFGVGFYSAFMVADKVTLHTQKAGESDGVVWDSQGDGAYTIDTVPRPGGTGTTITLHLKESKDVGEQDFIEEWSIKGIVKKYSDFIAYPIKMKTERDEPQKDSDGKVIEGKTEKVITDETLNSQKALWLKSPSEIKEEEYSEFYNHISHDYNKPLKTIHYKAEGMMEFASLLYIPEQQPWNYNYRETKYGLNLYVKRVFIMNDCEELIPNYLRFLKGLVDSSDLSLNVSREILQQDRQVQQIQKSLASKVLKVLTEMLEKDRESYEKFWENFGATLKEGIVSDPAQQEKLKDLFLFHTDRSDKITTLKEYVSRMKENQKHIYYINAESLQQAQNSPFLERLRAKEYEVLILVDPVDEWVTQHLTEFDGKKLQSVTQENLDLDTEEEKKASEEKKKEYSEKLKPLMENIKVALKEHVKDVQVSDRLTDSPVCLVSSANDPSAHMERIMAQLGKDLPQKAKRILELNPKHPLVEKMLTSSEDTQKKWADILYNQALLTEGTMIPDPMKFSQQLNELMMGTKA